MKIEHFAINVSEPVKMAEWYAQNLGLRIVKQDHEPPYMTFLADDSGRVLIEIYTNPADEVPEYANMNPLVMHIAWVSEDPKADKKNLVAAGASVESDEVLDDGSQIVMLRDPWGIPIQLCKRANSMLTEKEGDRYEKKTQNT